MATSVAVTKDPGNDDRIVNEKSVMTELFYPSI